jgi:hypothetical protein
MLAHHQVRFWANIHQVRFWANIHQVRFWANIHQVRFWANIHQVTQAPELTWYCGFHFDESLIFSVMFC